MFGFGTYTYVSVCFNKGTQPYSYRTNIKSIKAGDIVVVPVSNDEKIATVTAVKKYKKADVPYPIEKTKFVIRKATKADVENDPARDMRVPMDISVTNIRTASGIKTVVIDRKERDALKRRLASKADMKFIEKYPVSMAGQVVREAKNLMDSK